MFGLSGDLSSSWFIGKATKIMITRGLWSQRWATPLRRYQIFTVLCLGRQEPDGGVVLGLRVDLEDFIILYDFYICLSLLYITMIFAICLY